ncbi:hypothetical protein H0B56_09900 [Haloechinothrix sp. YIM 98757]|uniref:Uncharacterized protein n=1 Tax=Haloechinothrix aidingensis TaxID=2752311 RepID=A0A838A013_9PSEU|nr:hypothetical protein [Haloechinothrix aidingensis]MBA0125854.1 hypothetical protein [Haloechinothrix aidingensis]
MFDQQPAPERRGHLRPVKPPKAVWVDLGAVYPIADRPRLFLADGLDLQMTVPGELRMWDRTTTGHWVGWVTFPVRSGTGTAQQGQWVLSDALTPRLDTRDRH